MKDLIDLAKARPGQLNFVSAYFRACPSALLAGELFKNMTGIDMVARLYKGRRPALTDLLGGARSEFIFRASHRCCRTSGKDGCAVAVTSAKRTAVMPDTPTIAESGLPGNEVGNWYAIVAPAATSRTVVTQLNREIVRALTVPGVKKRFLELAADPVGSTPAELTAYNRSEIAKWANVIKSAGIKPE